MKTDRITFIVFMLLMPVILSAQTTLTGNVTDVSSGERLTGVNVYIPDLQKGTVTDENGNYKIENIPYGLFKVQFSFIGYKTKLVLLKADSGTKEINVELEPTVIQSQEVVVTGGKVGSQHENALKIDNVGKDYLDASVQDNLFKKLEMIPGVSTVSKGNNIATPVVRGLSTSNLVVLNNGIRLENFQFSIDHPYTIDESDIRNVEIIKGPASLLYGSDAVGGVINFIKIPPAPVGTVKSEVRTSFNTNDHNTVNSLNVRGSGDNFFAGITGYLASSADYYSGDGIRVPNSRGNSYSGKMFAGYRNGKIISKLYYDYNKLKPGITNPPAVNLVDDNSRQNEFWYQDLDNHLLSLENTLFLDKLKLDVDFSFQDNKRRLIGNPQEPVSKLVDMELKSYIWKVKGSYDFSSKSNLIVVAQGFSQSNTNGNAPDHVLPDYTQTSASLASLWQLIVNDKTFFQSGLRFDYKVIDVPEQYKSNNTAGLVDPFHKSYNNVSFSTGFTRKFADKLLLRGNVASAYRTPSIAELMQDGIHGDRYEVGNRDFVPQRNIEGDMSVHYHSAQLAFDVSGFYNRIFDYIFLAPTADTTDAGLDIYRYMQENAKLAGVEVFAGYTPFSYLKLSISYSHLYSELDNGDPLPFIPQDKISLNINSPFQTKGVVKKVSIGLNPLFAFDQNRPYILETPTDHYFLLNASLRFSVKIVQQPLELSIFANNLLNETYFDHLSTLKGMGYHNMGRNFNFRLLVPIN
ncbi:MAG: TonB-dependent receptor [Chlorobi bacterium]|nr:TonB-dependent receptor [Chlorobiota bacterium]